MTGPTGPRCGRTRGGQPGLAQRRERAGVSQTADVHEQDGAVVGEDVRHARAVPSRPPSAPRPSTAPCGGGAACRSPPDMDSTSRSDSDRGEQVRAPHADPPHGPAVWRGGDRPQRQVDGGDRAGAGLCGGDGQRAAAGSTSRTSRSRAKPPRHGLGAGDTTSRRALCPRRSESNLVRHTPVTRCRSSSAERRRAQAGRGDDPGPVAVRLLELQHRGDGARVVEGAQGGDGACGAGRRTPGARWTRGRPPSRPRRVLPADRIPEGPGRVGRRSVPRRRGR